MKVKIFLGLAIILLLLSTGCGGKKDDTPVQSQTEDGIKTVRIVTSFYPMYIMALNITEGIPGVEVVNMTKPYTGCLHDYQLTPQDLVTLQGADIFIMNGAGMESFLEKVIEQCPRLKMVDASQGIKADEENSHIWVSVSGAMEQVKNMEKQLAAIDLDHAEAYHINADKYLQKLEALRNKMHSVLDGVAKRDIITFHEAFPYFAKEFNLNIKAVIEREPGSEPSAKELAETVKTVKSEGVTVLFAEPQYSAEAAETIARETGATVYYLDPAVTGPLEPDAYITIMESNLKVLEEALN